jgi:hypothetical protein
MHTRPPAHTVIATEVQRGHDRVIAQLDRRELAIRNHRADTTERVELITMLRRAADLDLRLVDPSAAGPGKLDVAADNIATVAGSQPSRLQLVYADLGTPRQDRWNVYDAIRSALVDRGLLKEQVRFLHEVPPGAAREALYEACRRAEVAVLISTSRHMPPDLPPRAAAIHHLDCPQSVNDLRRREGGLTGEQCDVQIFRYVTPAPTDRFRWQDLYLAAIKAANASFPRPRPGDHPPAPSSTAVPPHRPAATGRSR